MPEQRPLSVPPLEVEVKPWPHPDPSDDQHHVELVVPDVARDAIDAHQFALHHGSPDVDPLDGHALLTRIKVAAGPMVLDGRCCLTVEDWSLAGDVMAVSNATRAGIQQAMEQARRRENRAKAHAADERDEYSSDRKLARIAQAIRRRLARLHDGEQIARRDLRRHVRADLRMQFDPTMAQLIHDGEAVEMTVDGGTVYTVGHRGRPRCPNGRPQQP